MNHRKLNCGLAIALLLVFGCAPHSPTGPHSQAMASWSWEELRDELRRRGLDVREADVIQQNFFTPPAHVLVVNAEDVQIYVYADPEAAESEAARVSPDGTSIGTSMMSWIAAPHFYRRANLIVLHLGENAAVARGLSEVLGPPFAGR